MDVTLALLHPWDMGEPAAVAQQALLHGLTAAVSTLLHMMPSKQEGSTVPTAAQVLQALKPSCMAANILHQNL